jgi:hypothetical protein
MFADPKKRKRPLYDQLVAHCPQTKFRAAAIQRGRTREGPRYRYGDSNPGFRTENCLCEVH